MALIPQVLKNFNLFVNENSYAGRVEAVTLPKLSIKTEEFFNGGLDAPIQLDMGMEKLECSMTLSEYDTEVIKCFGLSDAANNGSYYFQNIGSSYGKGNYKNTGVVSLKLLGALVEEDALTAANSASSGAFITPIEVNLTGAVVELDFGQWKAGEKSPLTIRLAVNYYRLKIDAETLIEIDVNNMERTVNGTDQVDAIRGDSISF